MYCPKQFHFNYTIADCVESLAIDARRCNSQFNYLAQLYSRESLKRKAAGQRNRPVNRAERLEDILAKCEIPTCDVEVKRRSLVGSSAVLLRRIQA